VAYLEQMHPLIVGHDQAELVELCPDCIREKNRPVQGGLPAWGQGEGWEEVTMAAPVPLDRESGTVSCRRGHRLPWERAIDIAAHPAKATDACLSAGLVP